jgi:hypothetical protein
VRPSVGQVWLLSYKYRSDVFLLLHRSLEREERNRSGRIVIWQTVRLSDGRLTEVTEEWVLDESSVLVS